MFCRETIGELRRLVERDPAHPPALFFFMGGIDHGREVFADLWPEARAVSDESLVFYRGLRLPRASAGRVFSLRTFRHAFRALRRGYRQTRVVGDPWMMPGLFLVRGDRILWAHRYRDPGDEPDYAAIPRLNRDLPG